MLPGGTDAKSAKRLPADYPKQAKKTAETRAHLAGIRTAEWLAAILNEQDG
jgi:hypothetical protein